MKNRLELIDNIKKGKKFSYLFFWGHHQKDKNIVDKSCFSQWFPAKFTIDDYTYPTAEHYMMAQKAKLFNDIDIFKEILEAKTPKEAKELGRKVKNFTNEIWDKKAFEIVIKGNFAKFSQNKALKQFLLDSYPNVLVEASPFDKIWGIGLSQDDVRAFNPLEWKGENYLGFALMIVRDKLQNNTKLKKEKKCPQHQN